MPLTKNESVGLWIGTISTVVPGLILADFFPEFNVLPAGVWLLVSGLGAMVAGAVAGSRKITGAIAGGLTGLGTIAGIIAYIAIRTAIFQTESFLRLEIAFGALIGAAPGLIMYWKFARQPHR